MTATYDVEADTVKKKSFDCSVGSNGVSVTLLLEK